ncbi:MAG: AraC family transcriptional regulator [Pseudomonadota bacterium]|nr:AraC family transcriptional regulator [Pseudomonadota bacterium]
MSIAALRSRTPTIHVSYVGAVGRYIARRGLEPGRLYGRYGWTADSVDEGQMRVRLADFFSLLDAAADYANDPHLGLHIYEHLDFADLGLLGFALLSATDVGSALRTLMRYGAIFQDCDDGQLLTERDYAHLFYRVSSSSLPPSRHDSDMSTAFTVFFLRKVVNPSWAPIAVQLQHPTPTLDLRSEYERVFQCPVSFGGATNLLTMPSSILAAPIQSSDKRLFDVIERHLRLLQEQSPLEGSLAQRVGGAIIQRLSTGPPSQEAVADALGMSPRDLQRELAANSLRFNELLEVARKELATRLLVTTTRSLAEITYLLGYSEETAFIRAFRRWMNCTPGDYRRSTKRAAGN